MKVRATGLIPLVLVSLPPLAFLVLYVRISNPPSDPQVLPPGLLALESPDGQALLADAEARADVDVLLPQLQTQEKMSWCGVASSATVLSAMEHKRVAQDDVFTDRASAVRSFWKVTFGGMPLDALAGILAAHDARVSTVHAADSNPAAFRAMLLRNLADPADFVIVNYTRQPLGQGDSGHFSPLGAYDEDTDRVLILDTASFRWPSTWVGVEALFGAMNTVDSDGGLSRGWVEVAR